MKGVRIGWKVTEKISWKVRNFIFIYLFWKVIILKISVNVGVIVENKLRHSPCRFMKITMKINVFKDLECSNSLVNAPCPSCNQVSLKQAVKNPKWPRLFSSLPADAISQQEFTSCLQRETLSGLAKNATDLSGERKMGNHMGPTLTEISLGRAQKTDSCVISSLFLLILPQACLNSSSHLKSWLVSQEGVVYLLISSVLSRTLACQKRNWPRPWKGWAWT